MKITADEAREYFSHPSQWQFGIRPDTIPETGVEYWANGPICGVFHDAPWPGVVQVHYAVKPEGWGRLVEPALKTLREFANHYRPLAIIGFTEERNRAACALTRRCGFQQFGRLDLPTGAVILTEWRP